MRNHKCPTCGAPLLFSFEENGFTFKKEITAWVEGQEAKGLSSGYLRPRKSRLLHHVLPFFKDIDVRAVRTFHVHTFHVALLKKKLSSKTIKHILDDVKAFLYHCLQMEMIERMPVFPKVKVVYKEKAWLGESAQQAVLQTIKQKAGADVCLPFNILFETGCRPGEVRALKKKDLRDTGVVIERAYDEKGFLKSTKTGKTEFKPLSNALYQRLTEASTLMLPKAFLFPWARTRNKLSGIWRKARAPHGLTIPLYQAARHSKASQRRQELEAASRDELRKVLNHTTAATTLKHYALSAEKEVKL